MSNVVRFLKSAVLPKDFPPTAGPEVAIVGRSNAGKSSFLNALCNSKVAKVSNTPGKTRLLNFFSVGEHYRLVDMPGYGYASRSGDEVVSWQEMIEGYLVERPTLVGCLLVMDLRRAWSDDEKMMAKFLAAQGVPLAIVATKIDKLTRNELNKLVTKLKKDSRTSLVFPTSALKKLGQKEVEEFVFEFWIKPALGISK